MILKIGSKGSEVKAWQQFLNSRGERLDIDGNFGPMVKAATQRFQGAFGLTADGIVGPGTLAKAKEFGYSVSATSDEGKKAEQGKTILVSAGHSTVTPRDPGAVGNGYTEAYLTLELRDMVADRLRELGCKVTEDGADGESLPLKKAVALARQADVAIEFHWNAGPPAATGIEVLSKPNHKALAQKLAGAIAESTKLNLRGDKGWKADNSGQHHRLAFCEAGGLIVEVCFISSKVDMERYVACKQEVASALANVLASA